MKLIENHMVIGPPEPPDYPADYFESRTELSTDCKYREDCFCCFDNEGITPICANVDVCPDGRW